MSTNRSVIGESVLYNVPREVPMRGTVMFTAGLLVASATLLAQQRGGTPQTDRVPPVNTGANPYRVIRAWAQLTLEATPWGGSNGVAIDRDGKSLWATDRGSPGTAPGSLGTKGNPGHFLHDPGKE